MWKSFHIYIGISLGVLQVTTGSWNGNDLFAAAVVVVFVVVFCVCAAESVLQHLNLTWVEGSFKMPPQDHQSSGRRPPGKKKTIKPMAPSV